MTISMLDQMLFPLACGHEVVLGRMANLGTRILRQYDGSHSGTIQVGLGEGSRYGNAN
jgi:hypothetical protein